MSTRKALKRRQVCQDTDVYFGFWKGRSREERRTERRKEKEKDGIRGCPWSEQESEQVCVCACKRERARTKKNVEWVWVYLKEECSLFWNTF